MLIYFSLHHYFHIKKKKSNFISISIYLSISPLPSTLELCLNSNCYKLKITHGSDANSYFCDWLFSEWSQYCWWSPLFVILKQIINKLHIAQYRVCGLVSKTKILKRLKLRRITWNELFTWRPWMYQMSWSRQTQWAGDLPRMQPKSTAPESWVPAHHPQQAVRDPALALLACKVC